jgi:hypothetical protein
MVHTGAVHTRLNLFLGYRVLLLLTVLFCMCGCKKYLGQVRVSDAEVSGAYWTDFNTGKEDLTLNPDKTYVQVFASPARSFTSRGTWTSSNAFLGPTEVLLVGAVCSENDLGSSSTQYCSRNLVVHREGGHLRLALNESADWYYDRK